MIELPKIEAYNKDIDNPLLVRWMEFLNVRSERDMEDLKIKYDLPDEILIALEELDKLSQDPNMRMEALNKEMWIRDQIDMINMVKEAKNIMTEANKIKTEAESKMIEAENKMIEAENKLIKTAKNLKELGFDIELIKYTTGLDIETIKNL
jgi:hypothetical protein